MAVTGIRRLDEAVAHLTDMPDLAPATADAGRRSAVAAAIAVQPIRKDPAWR